MTSQLLKLFVYSSFVCLYFSSFEVIFAADEKTEELAYDYYKNIFEPQATYWCNKANLAAWNFDTNLTDENSKLQTEVNVQAAVFYKESWKNFTSFDYKNFTNATLLRIFERNSEPGASALEEKKLRQYNEDISNMTSIFSITTVCDFKNKTKCDLNLDPDVEEIITTSRNYDELLFYWKEWHEKSGRPMRKIYEDYVSLSNEIARLNDDNDMGEMWRDAYESDTFEEDLENLWLELKPFYEELHAYVRIKLSSVYGKDKVAADKPIPAHILGNMWAQSWISIYDIVAPFPNKPTMDISETMKKKGYTVKKMFDLADSYYKSLGLMGLPESFWNLSMLTRPKDRKVECHASAWDLCKDYDVRIKMCTKIVMEDLFTIHHEMGHVQYYMQYAKQPSTFRNGANPGFHEAIGDTMVLSVSTPKHLKEVGLLSDFIDDEEFDKNYLMMKALEKIAFLPFGYVIDKWRWKVFSGNITSEDYNAKWWEMRQFYQGIEPAIQRTETDFDPGAKMHVATDTPYISYFVSFVIQFQFHEALCLKSGQYDPNDPQKPLHKCDNYKSKEAGKLFGNMLRQGASRPWQDIMEELTGTRNMSTSSILKFFKPLFEFLKEENKKNNVTIGWSGNKEISCTDSKGIEPQTVSKSTPKPELQDKKDYAVVDPNKLQDLKQDESTPEPAKLQNMKVDNSTSTTGKTAKKNGSPPTNISLLSLFLLMFIHLLIKK